MRSDWRELARRPAGPRDKTREAKVVERLTGQWKAARVAPEAPPVSEDEVDYVMETRRVALTKGKWRRFPPEVKPDPETPERP